MTRSILLAASALLVIGASACNKREEVVVNDPMAENAVVDIPTDEGNIAEVNAVDADVANTAEANAVEANESANAGNATNNGY